MRPKFPIASLRRAIAPLFLFALAAAPASAQTPVETVGGWSISDERGWCSASILYSRDIRLRLVFDEAANSVELFVWNRAWGWIRQDQDYGVSVSFNNKFANRAIFARGVPSAVAGGTSVGELQLRFRGSAVLEDFARASTLELMPDGRRVRSLPLRGASALVQRLRACAAASASRHPPISPAIPADAAASARITRPPVHRSGTITDFDYPAAASRAGEQGSVTVALAVGADGLVTGCSLLRSSGSATLDSRTCAIARHRFRFSPAVDVDGRPVAGRATRSVRWTLPEPEPVVEPKR